MVANGEEPDYTQTRMLSPEDCIPLPQLFTDETSDSDSDNEDDVVGVQPNKGKPGKVSLGSATPPSSSPSTKAKGKKKGQLLDLVPKVTSDLNLSSRWLRYMKFCRLLGNPVKSSDFKTFTNDEAFLGWEQLDINSSES